METMSDPSLNKQIAEALHGKLHYVVESGETFFYRVGVDDLNGIAYDVLEDYANSLDAVVAELKGKDVRLELDFEDGTATIYTLEAEWYPGEYRGASVGKVDVFEAAARALLAYAEATRKDGTHG